MTVVGKLAIQVIREANGRYRAHLMGKTKRLVEQKSGHGADGIRKFPRNRSSTDPIVFFDGKFGTIQSQHFIS